MGEPLTSSADAVCGERSLPKVASSACTVAADDRVQGGIYR